MAVPCEEAGRPAGLSYSRLRITAYRRIAYDGSDYVQVEYIENVASKFIGVNPWQPAVWNLRQFAVSTVVEEVARGAKEGR
ncbi:hypothetical protein [Mesorhizobium sp. WSM3224]|uniref:hypothetical protein n=1 Tax=Mesorhizobium sp. WSM3224 TaxID=1040986 RepID=UPI0012EBE92C|nr:hypothetical protein [Mesorhizobium sp. WSM3224]